MDKKELRAAVQEMNTYQFGQKKELTNKLSKVTSYVLKQEVVDMVSKLDKEVKAELPVIPQFVADYVESKDEWTASEIFSDIDDVNESSEPISEWMYDNDEDENSRREILLLKCVRGNYAIEKEKLYKVTFLENRHILTRRTPKEPLPYNFTIVWEYSEEIQKLRAANKNVDKFTEREIKAIDERYWAFAEEVTK